jgi:hypothetical protein
MDAEAKLRAVRELIGAPAPVVQPTNMDELLEQAKNLPADFKIKLITAMGFSPTGSDHQDDCIRYTHGTGFRCGCVPPATWWNSPKDVQEFRKETWDDQLAKAKQWSREGTHGREKEEIE